MAAPSPFSRRSSATSRSTCGARTSVPVRQVSRTEPTLWKWGIEANSSGTQRIYLVVDAIYSVEGKDVARSASLDKTIIVEVQSWDARWAWVKRNWEIVAFVLTAIDGLIALVLKRRPASGH